MNIYEKYKQLQEQMAMTKAAITTFEYFQQKYSERPDIYASTLPGLEYLHEEQAKIQDKITKVEEVIKLVEQMVEETNIYELTKT